MTSPESCLSRRMQAAHEAAKRAYRFGVGYLVSAMCCLAYVEFPL
jgi:hypothetical protein